MRSTHWLAAGFLIATGAFLYWAQKVDLVYGVWGQYQKTQDEKYEDMKFEIFGSLAKEWGGLCVSSPAFKLASNEIYRRQSAAQYAAEQIGNVGALYCHTERRRFVDDPYWLSSDYEDLKLALLIIHELPPRMRIIMDDMERRLGNTPVKTGINSAKYRYKTLQKQGIFNPERQFNWPDPYDALHTHLARKKLHLNVTRQAKHWNGLCAGDPRMNHKRKWRKKHHQDRYYAAKRSGNVAALYCFIDEDLVNDSAVYKGMALENLFLVEKILGNLPSDRQALLDRLRLKYTESDLSMSKLLAESRYERLILYGAIEPKPDP